MAQKYAYAVMDGNEAPDQYRFPASCHRTLVAAKKEANRRNSRNPNNHYYVIHWDAKASDRERPAPNHPDGL